MSSFNRKYYQDIQYKPFLFYVVFGVSGNDLQVSRSKHHVDFFPEKLEILSLNRTEHNDYINGFFNGQLGTLLKEDNADLFEKCRAADKCVILRGEIEKDATLDYIQSTIGILQSFMENGALGVLDLFTFTLYDSNTWSERFFEKDINAQDHVTIFVSEQDHHYWLHTRGMGKFGRPDLSLFETNEENIQKDKAVIDQMIYYSGEGAFFNGEVIIHTNEGKYKVLGEFVPDWNNDDFNNAHINIQSIEKIEE